MNLPRNIKRLLHRNNCEGVSKSMDEATAYLAALAAFRIAVK